MRVNSVRLGLKKKKKGERRASSVWCLSVDHTVPASSPSHTRAATDKCGAHTVSREGIDSASERGGREREEREREREREREWGGNLKSLKPIWTRTQVCVNQEFIPPIILISGRARGGVRKSGPESKWRLVQGSRFRERIAAFMLYYISKSFQLI